VSGGACQKRIAASSSFIPSLLVLDLPSTSSPVVGPPKFKNKTPTLFSFSLAVGKDESSELGEGVAVVVMADFVSLSDNPDAADSRHNNDDCTLSNGRGGIKRSTARFFVSILDRRTAFLSMARNAWGNKTRCWKINSSIIANLMCEYRLVLCMCPWLLFLLSFYAKSILNFTGMTLFDVVPGQSLWSSLGIKCGSLFCLSCV
jgi:hypothetical protein